MPRRSTDQDIAIGARIRERRIDIGMGLQALGRAVGLTYQQIQKYETGVNRVASGRLLQIADALDCPAQELMFGHAQTFNAPGDSARRAINGYLSQMSPEMLRATLNIVKALRTVEAR